MPNPLIPVSLRVSFPSEYRLQRRYAPHIGCKYLISDYKQNKESLIPPPMQDSSCLEYPEREMRSQT